MMFDLTQDRSIILATSFVTYRCREDTSFMQSMFNNFDVPYFWQSQTIAIETNGAIVVISGIAPTAFMLCLEFGVANWFFLNFS